MTPELVAVQTGRRLRFGEQLRRKPLRGEADLEAQETPVLVKVEPEFPLHVVLNKRATTRDVCIVVFGQLEVRDVRLPIERDPHGPIVGEAARSSARLGQCSGMTPEARTLAP